MGRYANSSIAKGESLLGLEYVYAGDSETGGLDCSHFVWHCIRQAGYPGMTSSMYGACVEPMCTMLTDLGWEDLGSTDDVGISNLKKGDVVMRGTSANQAHTGLVYKDGGAYQIDCGGGHNVVATDPPGAQHGVAVRTMTSWDHVLRYPKDPDDCPILWCGDRD